MPMNKPHLEFHRLDMNTYPCVPSAGCISRALRSDRGCLLFEMHYCDETKSSRGRVM
jgi:hypothetical protein